MLRSGAESITMSSGELDATCGMLCLDLCIVLGCGDGLVLEGARHVLFGRGASFEVPSCDRMRLRPRVGESHRRLWALCVSAGPSKGDGILIRQAMRSREVVNF